MSISSPSVCVIIPNYNGRENLRECLRYLRKLEYGNFNVTVVDGGSTDGSCEMVESEFADVNLIKYGERVGYGKGINQVIRSCTSKYVALLDNDTNVEPHWLTALVERLEEDSTVGIAGSKVYFHGSARVICSAGGTLNLKNGFILVLGLGEIDRGQYDELRSLDWVSGAAIVASRKLISKVGYLDEGYEFYREEVDLCYQARRMGYKVLFVPSSIVWHKVSKTTSMLGVKFYYIHRSWIRFCLVNLSSFFVILGSFYAIIFTLMEATAYLWRGSSKEMKAGVSAIFWNLSTMRRILARRRFVSEIISNASVND